MRTYFLCFALQLAACAVPMADEGRMDDDWDTALAGSLFDKNLVYSDEFFRAENIVTADQIQAFFERTNYGNRCWLADERVGGRRAADVLIDVARQHHVNPIMLVARIQVEQSGIARSARPPASTVDKLFGCGCPDNRPCDPQYRGLANQLSCAGEKLDKNFRRSNREPGLISYGWHPGTTKSTLDPISVTPQNTATAALYAYTPWVYAPGGGSCGGGNCAVQAITRRVLTRFYELGLPMSVDVISRDVSGGGATDGGVTLPGDGVSCSHSFGGVYAHLGCSGSYQCVSGAWRQIGDASTCVCRETTGRTGCAPEPAPMEPAPMEPAPMEPAPMEPSRRSCSHSAGGTYPDGGCTRSYQCVDGSWQTRTSSTMCICVSDWGTGCTG